MQIHDVKTTLVESVGELAIRRSQYIPDDFTDHLADQRFDSVNSLMGDKLYRVASVPVALAEKWLREDDFNVYTAPVQETMKRLRLEGFDKFLATKKQI